MSQVKIFAPIFEEMIKLAEGAKMLLEGERGLENIEKELERLIEEFHFFLSQTEINEKKIDQSVTDLKAIFQDVVEFFSRTLTALNTNQAAIQAYSLRALEGF